MKKILALALLMLLATASYPQSREYGLRINTYPMPAGQYTNVTLDNGKPIDTGGEVLTVSFQMRVRPDNVFGTVLTAITDHDRNIDFMFSADRNDRRTPTLVIGDEVHPLHRKVRNGIWTKATLTFNPKDGSLTTSYDGETIRAVSKSIEGVKNLRITFGQCLLAGRVRADVASVDIRNIKILRGKEVIRFWKMGLHDGNVCYDETTRAAALCKNPSWLIDRYSTWRKVFTHKFSTPPSVAFNPEKALFHLATDNRRLYTLDAETGKMTSINVNGGEIAANYPNQMVYISQRQQLLSYNLNENIYSVFNTADARWEGSQKPVKEHDYWNNTAVYNPADSSIVSFGGYGHYHYNNELLTIFPYNGRKPQRVRLKEISPRYSAGSVIIGNTLYIFGGRGCPSGRQELSPRNYYDLYAVNLHTKRVKRLWEAATPPKEGDYLPTENLIHDARRGCLYFFCNQKNGVLMRMDLKSYEIEQMSLPLGANLESQYRYYNIYYSPAQEKLYVVIVMSKANNETEVAVYELNFPPVAISTLTQAGKNTDNAKANIIPYALGTVVLCLIAGATVATRCRLHRRKRHVINDEKKPLKPENGAPEPVTEADEPSVYDFTKSCVCFLGGFKVLNREGSDITGQFTPVLKSLLILLILYTGKDGKGITSQRLVQTLWPDKSESSASNNRNVSISKLRGILETVGDIKILNQYGAWNIQFNDTAFCDYLEIMRLYRSNNGNGEKVTLELLLRGMMLPDTEKEWVDAFKNDFSDTTIDVLGRFLRQDNLSDSLKIRIADTLFQHDYINEEALSVKCYILSRQGKMGLAKHVYDIFCKDYESTLGINYKLSLKAIIEKGRQEN